MYIKVKGLKRDSLISGYSYNYYCFNVKSSNSMGDQSTGANVNEITEEEPMVIEDDKLTEVEDEQMEIERDIDLMDTDDESDNDFESEHASDIEFMNDEQLSDEGEPSFYRCFDNSL